MKNYIFILFISLFSISCALKQEPVNFNQKESTILLTKHDWKGVKVTEFVNQVQTKSARIENHILKFDSEGNFKKIKNNITLQDGDWQWLDTPNTRTLRINYFAANLNYNDIDDLEINILSDDFFEFNIVKTDSQKNTIRLKYLFKK